MNEADLLARKNPQVVCNKCKMTWFPYPSSYAPVISEVICPNCKEPRILYFGEDPSVEKMLLSTFGVNKGLNEKLAELHNDVANLKEYVKTSLIDAKNVMTTAIIKALNQEIREHEQKYHNVKPH